MQLALFEVEAYRPLFYQLFLESELGQLFTTIPFQELGKAFQPEERDSKVGAPPTFSVEGGIGLMFLKHYTGLFAPQNEQTVTVITNQVSNTILLNAIGKLTVGVHALKIPVVLESGSRKSTIVLRGRVDVSCPNS
jgi:hypothetical protein